VWFWIFIVILLIGLIAVTLSGARRRRR